VRVHPAAELFPLLDGAELQALADDIKAHGLRQPITLHEGAILDGRNRQRACEIAGVTPTYVEWDGSGGSPTAWVLSLNLHRRHLNESQRAMVGADAVPLFEAEARARRAAPRELRANLPEAEKGRARDKAAKTTKVSGRSVADAQKVKNQAAPEVAAAVRAGKLAVSAAAKITKRPADEQRELVRKVEKGEAKNLQQAERQLDDEKRIASAPRVLRPTLNVYTGDAVANLRDLKPRAHCVVMDPPYGLEVHRTRQGGKDYTDGRNYALALLEKTCGALVDVLDPSAHLYVFSGYSYVHDFKQILRNYFEVQDNPLVWVKSNHTMADFSRWYANAHEYVLFAKMKGSTRKLGAGHVSDVFQVSHARESTHSAEKPVELLTHFIERSTAPGDLVLDPFCGSGSTGVAAAQLKRAFVGIDMESKWTDLARARLAEVA
jgi:DNA modification methylase